MVNLSASIGVSLTTQASTYAFADQSMVEFNWAAAIMMIGGVGLLAYAIYLWYKG